MGRMCIVPYKPKPGKEEVLLELVRSHVPILRSQGLVTGFPPAIMQALDGTLVEVFEWESEEAIAKAHTNPAVLEMWTRFGEACDYIKLADVPECQELFAGFKPV